MIDTLVQKRYFPLLLFLFAFGLFTINNQGFSIYILDEAKNSSCAREMFENSDFFKPTFNYNLRADKPPVHYFFMMVSYSVFGVNEWAARFFSGIFGALTILVTFIYTCRFINKKTAFYTALVLLASLHLVIQFHLAVPDPYLIFFFCWSLFLFYSAIKTKKRSDIFLMYISIALASLVKGPMAIAIPGLIFLLFLIFSKQFKWAVIKKLKPFTGVIIVLVIAAPWYIINGIETNWEWTHGFFVKHNFQRYGSEMEGHGGIFLLTFAYVIIGLLPFSIFLVPAIKKAWANKSNSFILFCLITSATIVAFFSISQTKLPNYTVPAYPFLAVLIGHYFSEIKTRVKLNPWYIILFIISLAVPVGGYFALKADTSLSMLSSKILWLLFMPAGVLISFIFLKKEKINHSIFTLAAFFITTSIIFFTIIFPAVDKQNPVSKSINILEGKEVAYYKKFNASYAFYLKKKIPELEKEEINSFFTKNPDGILISIESQVKDLDLPEGCKIIFKEQDLMENPTTVLIAKE